MRNPVFRILFFLVLLTPGLWLTPHAQATDFKMGVVDPQSVLEKSKAGKRALDGLKEYVSIRQKLLAKDHAQGAQHLGKGIIERDIEAVVPNKQDAIVLYCGGGFRSALAADALQQMGYQHVRSMEGGIRAWREAGYPVE
jgi:rhodanese-related sulfurtransferase